MQNKDSKNILIVGMGGQGVITAARVLGLALVYEGYDVKTTEVHGMAQRGGSVDAHVRFGQKVYSPMIGIGQADLLIALEELEAVRFAPFLKQKGLLLLYPERRIPASLRDRKEVLPGREVLEGQEFSVDIIQSPGAFIKSRPNMLLLGRLSMELDIKDNNWEKALGKILKPVAFERAIKDFTLGKNITRAKEFVATA